MLLHDATAPAHPSREVILIVEDDPAVGSSLQFSLEVEGYHVRLFPDVASLLADTHLPPRGCIVSDYFLPDGNGLDLIQTLRARGVSLPAILLTSNPGLSLRHNAELAQVPIVEKPLLDDAFGEEIRAAIARVQ